MTSREISAMKQRLFAHLIFSEIILTSLARLQIVFSIQMYILG